ncbi:unknown [Odoribacter laneus CAG:561]|nr:unknown [Odoribacter laneus CAG:561]
MDKAIEFDKTLENCLLFFRQNTDPCVRHIEFDFMLIYLISQGYCTGSRKFLGVIDKIRKYLLNPVSIAPDMKFRKIFIEQKFHPRRSFVF